MKNWDPRRWLDAGPLKASIRTKPVVVITMVARSQSRILAKSVFMSVPILGGAARELITGSADRFDMPAAGAELAAKMAHVHINGAVQRACGAIIQLLHDLVACENAAGSPHEHLENVEFQRRYVDSFPGTLNLARTEIERDITDL